MVVYLFQPPETTHEPSATALTVAQAAAKTGAGPATMVAIA